jgi:L-fucono-1,5-lactonase
MIIDAHQHFWTADYAWLADPSLAPIRRDYSLTDLRALMSAAGVDRTVLVEAGLGSSSETTSFLALASSAPEIAGVVGWAPLTSPSLGSLIDQHRAEAGGRLLVGIRDQVQGEDDTFLDRGDVRDGLAVVASAGLVNELVVRASQLPSVARVIASLPSSTFVLDHLGKPPIADGGLASWRASIEPVAELPNVVAKVSGLVSEASWSSWKPADLAPYVDTALSLFGPRRLMWGSDWPVLEVAATYSQVKSVLTDLLGGEDPDVFGGTAIRTYHLEIM